jgi:hypothetical protein
MRKCLGNGGEVRGPRTARFRTPVKAFRKSPKNVWDAVMARILVRAIGARPDNKLMRVPQCSMQARQGSSPNCLRRGSGRSVCCRSWRSDRNPNGPRPLAGSVAVAWPRDRARPRRTRGPPKYLLSASTESRHTQKWRERLIMMSVAEGRHRSAGASGSRRALAAFAMRIPTNPGSIPLVIQRQPPDRAAVLKLRGHPRSSRTAFVFALDAFDRYANKRSRVS